MAENPTTDSPTPEVFHCKHCEKQFSSAGALDMHVGAKHSEHAPKPAGESLLKKHKWKVILLAVLFLVGAGAWALYSSAANAPKIGPIGSTHIHMDVKVYIEGQPINFALPKYQLRAQHVHFESGEGDYVHVHATGVSIGMMFETLGMKFSADCLKSDDGRNLCNGDGGKTLKFYVNNRTNTDYGSYVLQDLDKIMVSYGSESEQEVQAQLASVTDKAKNENMALIDNPLAVHTAAQRWKQKGETK